jgi:uncharacterized protein (DUF1778 family)
VIPPFKHKAPDRLTIRLTEDERRELERIAAMQTRTMTNVVKLFLVEGLKKFNEPR